MTCIIDLFKLHENTKLNDVMRIIFDSSIVFGMNFCQTLKILRDNYTNLTSFDNIPRFLDIKEFYKAIFLDYGMSADTNLPFIC